MDMDITLRQYQLSDIDPFIEWACDPEVLRFSRLQRWVHANSSKADIESYFTQVVIPHPWYRAICLNGHPIGFVSIQPAGTHEYFRGRASISCALGRNYWGRGIATFAVRRATSLAFEELPHLNRIEGFVNPKNKGSQKMFEKVGFLKEGVLRNCWTMNGEGVDQIVYSFLPTDL